MLPRTRQPIGTLWRVVFTELSPRGNVACLGPWHPERERVEAWVVWFRARGMHAVLQSSEAAGIRPRGPG
ncbi:hypothetical protein AAW51_0510 [Caldimonas brevitalea]|uniref:Uncharacterized protein n=1 Tax=Caldimonas brevitalea TaxID=413882 RepID=A0A0G3BII9_9BURK|nr:hypothetical protein AAW51_0510 [Caldimonas brevitalea]